MRYTPEHKEETRERIVQAAARRFRKGGAGVGIAELMKASKLTHGGFYRHFRSKDELLAAAIEKAIEENRERIARAVADAPRGCELEAIIDAYLSQEHCAHPAGGCPLAALGTEIARQPRVVRESLEQGLVRIAARTAPLMPGATDEERRANALTFYSAMAGTLALARAVMDDQLRRSILAAGRASYREFFAREHR